MRGCNGEEKRREGAAEEEEVGAFNKNFLFVVPRPHSPQTTLHIVLIQFASSTTSNGGWNGGRGAIHQAVGLRGCCETDGRWAGLSVGWVDGSLGDPFV